MAAENSSEPQDEKAALLKTDEGQEGHPECGTVAERSKRSESKLTLYHWTQSLNSQKVSVATLQHRVSEQFLIGRFS